MKTTVQQKKFHSFTQSITQTRKHVFLEDIDMEPSGEAVLFHIAVEIVNFICPVNISPSKRKTNQADNNPLFKYDFDRVSPSPSHSLSPPNSPPPLENPDVGSLTHSTATKKRKK